METGIIYQTSLIAAFVAGMVALFAPCCITFLLPAYLGSVFKEKEKVILMTLVFGAGIFVVLLPAVLGIAALSQALFVYHDPLYIIGALVMLITAVVTLLGIKLPMPKLPGTNPQKTDVLSIFSLGIMSGITSACCAPVLIGILTLTFLSPNYFGALTIGGMYVLGMVTPLLLISIFLAGKMPAVAILRKNLATIKLMGREFHILTSNLIASFIFFVTGWLILVLTLSGRLKMADVTGFTKTIQGAGSFANGYVGNNLGLNIAFALGIIGFFYWLSKKV
ncbi:MAG: cytochrome c biogenesis protein CcdA [bacterium]|nr:cytochrome c biogenesis protein CcdA [bacterium]